MGHWINKTIKEIENLKFIERNWNNDDFPEIDPTIIKSAIELVEEFYNEDIGKPHITPESGGSISLEWSTKYGEIEISFINENEIVLLYNPSKIVPNKFWDLELDIYYDLFLIKYFLSLLYPKKGE